ncbi:MAG: trigger factor [Clostridiales bacterium]|nr:trigger factor [Eubacteriales bacterium]MDH7566909.1 trigger factor [Clostridiales bacterium]
MNVKVENIEKNVVQLEIEVDAAKFEQGMQKSFQKNAGRFNVPGFRRGKAPRKLVERYYGEQVLYDDAVNFVCPEAYDEAIEQNNIQAVDKPEIDIKQIGKGQNLVFTAKVTVKPEVELGEYKGMEVSRKEVHVTEEDVEKELQKVVEKNARMVSVEDRDVQKGDILTIDFEGFIDGVPFDGGKAEGYSLEIGSGQFIPGFEDQLVGAKLGDEVEVNVSFPEDYHAAELAGKPALFKVKVKEIKMKELPAVDDEFAKDVSEFDTLEAYKEDLRKKLVEKEEKKATSELEDQIINKLVENTPIDLPQVMIEKRIDSLIADFEMRLYYQGLSLQKYLEMMNLDMNTLRSQFSKRAEKDVRTQLILEKIGKVEGIQVPEEDIAAEIKKLAESYQQNEEEFKKHLAEEDIEYIKENLVVRKTVDFLVANAKISITAP